MKCLDRLASMLVAPLPRLLIGTGTTPVRSQGLSLSIGSFPICQFCPNTWVCHIPAWLCGRPSPLARPPRQGPLHNIAPKGKRVGHRLSQPVLCASDAHLATPAPLRYHYGQMGCAQLALRKASLNPCACCKELDALIVGSTVHNSGVGATRRHNGRPSPCNHKILHWKLAI